MAFQQHTHALTHGQTHFIRHYINLRTQDIIKTPFDIVLKTQQVIVLPVLNPFPLPLTHRDAMKVFLMPS